MALDLTRRKFLVGLGAAGLVVGVAPAIVKIENIMRVRAPRFMTLEEYARRVLNPMVDIFMQSHGYLEGDQFYIRDVSGVSGAYIITNVVGKTLVSARLVSRDTKA